MKNPKIVITFDLKEDDDYETAYDILTKLGLYTVSINKKLKLPNTTVMGILLEEVEAADIRDYIWGKFEEAGLRPTHIFGGILEDWAVKIKN